MLRNNKNNLHSILLTLAYSDIFEYPLREEELYKFQIPNSKFQIPNAKSLEHWKFKNGYYYFKGREEIINKRIKREHSSKKKIIFAQKIVSILKCIPTIQLIGLSGSLAMLNADEADDIDLFIIAKYKTLWISRLAVLSVLQMFDVRRTRNTKKTQDAICTNMFVDESILTLPKRMQNLYTAHEVVQMKPVFVKNDFDRKFLEANEWIREYLPNAFIEESKEPEEPKGENFALNILEKIAKKVQLWYMKKHRTTETITDTLLAFHPQDQSKYVLGEFEKRIKNML